MVSNYPEQFQGISVAAKNEYKKADFAPKKFDAHDIDIEVECCGVCGSDAHAAASNWGECPKNAILGHEIVGRVVKLGPECNSGLKIGDRVGVGAQAASCLECRRCKEGNESYCPKTVFTIISPYEDGYMSQGGFASHVRVHEHFAVPIPDEIPSHLAGPLFCGGVTVFSPLYRNGCSPGKKVGIVGIGGIGHMGIIFAKAMGAEVYAFSRRENKREDAMKLGADHYIATEEEEDWEKKYFDTLDLVVVCASSLSDIHLDKYAKVMTVGATIISIAIPSAGEQLVLNPFGLVGVTVGNSAIGSPHEIKLLLDLVAKNNLKIWVETVPISEEGVKEVFTRMEKGDVRYRFALVDYDKQFK